jgi:hypothetical protein
MSAPTVTINRQLAQYDPAPRDAPIYFDIIFSKTVYGFSNRSVTLAGTTGANLVTLFAASTNSTAWTAMVTGMTSSMHLRCLHNENLDRTSLRHLLCRWIR